MLLNTRETRDEVVSPLLALTPQLPKLHETRAATHCSFSRLLFGIGALWAKLNLIVPCLFVNETQSILTSFFFFCCFLKIIVVCGVN